MDYLSKIESIIDSQEMDSLSLRTACGVNTDSSADCHQFNNAFYLMRRDNQIGSYISSNGRKTIYYKPKTDKARKLLDAKQAARIAEDDFKVDAFDHEFGESILMTRVIPYTGHMISPFLVGSTLSRNGFSMSKTDFDHVKGTKIVRNKESTEKPPRNINVTLEVRNIESDIDHSSEITVHGTMSRNVGDVWPLPKKSPIRYALKVGAHIITENVRRTRVFEEYLFSVLRNSNFTPTLIEDRIKDLKDVVNRLPHGEPRIPTYSETSRLIQFLLEKAPVRKTRKAEARKFNQKIDEFLSYIDNRVEQELGLFIETVGKNRFDY